MYYIATFYTHLGAMTFQKTLRCLGDETAIMMPVPRALSSSCGTCVRFEMEFDPEKMHSDEDLEKVVRVVDDTYVTVFENEE